MAAHDNPNKATSRATAGGAAARRACFALPCTAVISRDATAAERASILAEVARRRATGQRVLVVASPDEALDALVEAFAP